MHLDFRQLRNFVALVEYGSFNRAAEAVCLSQSAFSRSIQALEQSVGHPLFDRQSKLPTLTLHGQKLLPYARRFQELNVELSSQLREADDAQNGEVAFGCGPAPAASLIPAAVGEFHRLLPQARVRFQIDNWLALHQALTSQLYPFVVADSWQAELDPQLRVQPLSPQRCFFVCHADHPLAKQGPVSIQAMLRYPLPPPICRRACARCWRPSASSRTLPRRFSAIISTRCLPPSRRPAQLASPARTASRYVSTAIGWLSWSSAICLRSGG
ncbi:transcriptional regulator [Klebsiella michiganensis]|nr:transcriptional regulator [Klebsiella michiganensis]